ncbi:MAG: hypothetical protein QM484_04150 [Woeseiaceae bacterium]
MTAEQTELRRIQRSFQNISDETEVNINLPFSSAEIGWYGSFGWNELLKSQRILIISEAGVGKTYECQREQTRLWKLGEPAFYFELSEFARNNIHDLLSYEEDERFNAWLTSQSDIATIFLDSIDELKLTLGSFETSLKRLNKALSGQLGRVKVIITTRPISIDVSLVQKYLPVPPKKEVFLFNDESFADVAMNRHDNKQVKSDDLEFKIVALIPLSDEQIKEMAEIQGVTDAEALLEDIRRRNAEDFAQRPQDLIELCVDWRNHNRIRTHKDQVAYNIRIKLKPSIDRVEKVQLTEDKAFNGASRLALAALLARKLTFRHNAQVDVGGESDTALDPGVVLSDWSAAEQSALLERALFGFASYGRVRFHHRSVMEYLAAQCLENMLKNGMSTKAVKRLLFAETLQGIKIVKPSMRSVASWLALSQTSIFSELRNREPNLLLDYGDPESLSIQQRGDALVSYIEHYGSGNWRGLSAPRVQIYRFASIELSEILLKLWSSCIENPEVRELLLELFSVVPIPEGADIAYSVVLDPNKGYNERIEALKVLVKLSDPRLEELTTSMEMQTDIWPDQLVKNAIRILFPVNISAEKLCIILSHIPDSRNSTSNLDYFWSSKIADAQISQEYLFTMCIGLTNFILEGVKCQKESWAHIQTSSKHLVTPLAAICLRLFKDGDITNETINSCVIALRLSNKDYNEDKSTTELQKILAKMPVAQREIAFWSDDTFIQKYHSHENSWSRLYEVDHDGAISINASQDRSWILSNLSSLKRTVDERAVMLEVALRFSHNDQHYSELVLKEQVVDSPILISRVDDWFKPVPINHQHERMKKQQKKRKKQVKRREAKKHASWILFWREVANDPKTAFNSERKENTAWDLWQVMSRHGYGSREEGWNRRFIEQYFSKDIADQLRLTMMDIWRSEQPTLRSERPDSEKGTYLIKWQLGLAAISAESEDDHWAHNLTWEEAKLAAHYVPIEINSFPSWLESLVKVNSDAVEKVLGHELTSELDEIATTQYYSPILQDISHSTPLVVAVFIPSLRLWFFKNFKRVREEEDRSRVTDRLRRVVNILLEYGDKSVREQILMVAVQQLAENNVQVFVRMWLPILMQLDPVVATKQLEKIFIDLNTESKDTDIGVNLIGLLFDDRHNHGTAICLNSPAFTPDLLLRLIRLAYQHVRPLDDVSHNGSYSPGCRDYAQSGRNALLSALLNTKGPEGWVAKIEFSKDPLLENFRDRTLFIAQEKAAEEVDAIAHKESDLRDLNRNLEATPTTHEEMFSLLQDRIDDIEDLLLRDDSPREAWAGISDEKIMRREIARELRNTANNAYVVEQESVTADEKETDIRLRSVKADLEAVIELKLADNRSGRNLRDSIKGQLVKKYMASDICRSGCLLVTIAKNRTWKHPDTDKNLDILELESFLKEEALSVAKEMGFVLRVSARIIDLRPRLPTEKKKAIVQTNVIG